MSLLGVLRTADTPGRGDHMPRHDDDPRQEQAFAFGYGYIKALVQCLEA